MIALLLEALPSSSGAFTFFSNSRIRNLFFRTLVWSMSVSVGTVILASLASSFIWIKGLYKSLTLIVLLLLAFLVPPFIHSAAWSHILIDVFNLSYRTVASTTTTAWIQLCCYLSLAVGAITLALNNLDEQEIAVGKTLGNDFLVYRKVVLPSIKPVLMIILGLVFILSFADYTVPSLFAQNVYSLEIMAEFSSSYNAANALYLAIPLIFVQLVAFVIILSNVKKGIFQKEQRMKIGVSLRLPMLLQVITFTALAILVIVITIPIISLALNKGSLETITQALSASKREMHSSLRINFVAALSITIFVLPLSMSLMAVKRRKGVTILYVLPLVLPASLIGMSLIEAFYGILPREIYSSILLPVIAIWQKSLPFVLLLVLASLELSATKYLEAGNIYSSKSEVLLKILLPMQAPILLASFVISFIMGFNELGATLLVVPPGMTTLSIKIYNYLHYGATDFVNALCLVILLAATIAAIILGLLWKKRKALL
jgi:iron(III) transport system permease protein